MSTFMANYNPTKNNFGLGNLGAINSINYGFNNEGSNLRFNQSSINAPNNTQNYPQYINNSGQ